MNLFNDKVMSIMLLCSSAYSSNPFFVFRFIVENVHILLFAFHILSAYLLMKRFVAIYCTR